MQVNQLPAVTFRRSSFCASGVCVEVAGLPGGDVVVRDSKDTRDNAPVLQFTTAEWTAFLRGVGAGEFTPDALSVD
jgi:hypothetical protein